jgi:hypothetical protein
MAKDGIEKVWDGCKWVFKKLGNQGDGATNSPMRHQKKGVMSFQIKVLIKSHV